MQLPSIKHLELTLAGELVVASPERALVWPGRATLFIADAHFGKGAAFRAENVPIPVGLTAVNLGRLDSLIRTYSIQQLIFLGDTWHTHQIMSEKIIGRIKAWRDQYPTMGIQTVLGNHDAFATKILESCGFDIVEENTQWGPFVLRHQPGVSNNGYVLCGHLHPGAQLKGKARQLLYLPCFWLKSSYAVLPAFGVFTGLCPIKPSSADRVAVIAGNSVAWAPSKK